jgi:peptidoglycan/xylan/chitin deacetylase (PgdA/CDA1 family)
MYRINHQIIPHAIYVWFLWLIVTTGCTGMFSPQIQTGKPAAVRGEHFVLVTATEQDSIASLAKTYLHDANNGWWITTYNKIKKVTPGQRLVIPLIPLAYGGLEADGYQTVPILLYAHLAYHPTEKSSVSAQKFERQLNYLRENDFVTVSLDQFNAFVTLHDQLPPNAVMISFDTADRWVYDIAFPILKRHGMKATLFVPAEQIEQPGKLAWQQLAKMAAEGVDIGAHGPKLSSFTGKNVTRSIEKYIVQSKRSIERHLKQPCRDFSVPLDDISDLSTALLKKNGFRTGFTSKRGQNPFFVHNFKIRRAIIYGHYNLHQFGQNLITFHKAQLR